MFQKNSVAMIVLVLLIALTATACAGNANAPAPQPAPETQASQTEAPPVEAEQPEAEPSETQTDDEDQIGTFDTPCEGPFLITSVGQSADASMIEAMMKKLGGEYTFNPTVAADEVTSAGTVIVAAGASSKGLGAAGISDADEMARAEEMLSAAKENGAVVIAMHIGGAARRGELSDQFSDKVFEYADYIIMVKDGDQDGKYAAFAKDNNIPLTFVKSAAEAATPLKDALGL